MIAAWGQAPAAQIKLFQPDFVPFSSFHSVGSVFPGEILFSFRNSHLDVNQAAAGCLNSYEGWWRCFN